MNSRTIILYTDMKTTGSVYALAAATSRPALDALRGVGMSVPGATLDTERARETLYDGTALHVVITGGNEKSLNEAKAIAMRVVHDTAVEDRHTNMSFYAGLPVGWLPGGPPAMDQLPRGTGGVFSNEAWVSVFHPLTTQPQVDYDQPLVIIIDAPLAGVANFPFMLENRVPMKRNTHVMFMGDDPRTTVQHGSAVSKNGGRGMDFTAREHIEICLAAAQAVTTPVFLLPEVMRNVAGNCSVLSAINNNVLTEVVAAEVGGHLSYFDSAGEEYRYNATDSQFAAQAAEASRVASAILVGNPCMKLRDMLGIPADAVDTAHAGAGECVEKWITTTNPDDHLLSIYTQAVGADIENALLARILIERAGGVAALMTSGSGGGLPPDTTLNAVLLAFDCLLQSNDAANSSIVSIIGMLMDEVKGKGVEYKRAPADFGGADTPLAHLVAHGRMQEMQKRTEFFVAAIPQFFNAKKLPPVSAVSPVKGQHKRVACSAPAAPPRAVRRPSRLSPATGAHSPTSSSHATPLRVPLPPPLLRRTTGVRNLEWEVDYVGDSDSDSDSDSGSGSGSSSSSGPPALESCLDTVIAAPECV